MKITEFRQKLTGAGYVLAAAPEEIAPDATDGVKHMRLRVHKADGLGRGLKKTGYYHDVNGHLGEAGNVYPDYENGDVNLRAIFEPAVIQPSIAQVALAEALKRPGVIGVRAEDAGGCAIVSLVQIVAGIAVPKQVAVYRDGENLAVVPYEG